MRFAMCALVAALPAAGSFGAELLSPGDFIIAIDTTPAPFTTQSSYPGLETPANAIDGDNNSKYLNFGAANSGFIVTPNIGASIIQSMSLVTGNDSPERDPLSFELFGTNDPINSTDNSFGDGETWNLISSGPLAPPAARNDFYPIVNFANGTSYASYRLVFPTLAGFSNSMQISEVQFFTGANGTGTDVLNAGDPILAIDRDGTPQLYPGNEAPQFAIDDDPNTKFLNFGEDGAGLIVTPSGGPSVAVAMTITTANDFDVRDPASYEIYGTNDPISSPDNGEGDLENWTLISSGSLDLPTDRFTESDFITWSNSTAYTSYRIVFPSVRNGADPNANSFQIAEIQLHDVIPEPGSLALLGLGGLALLRRRR